MFSRGKLMLQAALKKNAQNGGTGIECNWILFISDVHTVVCYLTT